MRSQLLRWAKRWLDCVPGTRKKPRPRPTARLTLEPLEERALLSASSLVHPGADGRLVYTPDDQGNTIPDFSSVGYMRGNVALPDTTGGIHVPTRITLYPAPGDATARIQAALDQVGAMPLDANGFRGAVTLAAGTYDIKDHIEIRASGVVLRGNGISSAPTILRATGTAKRYNASDPRQDGLVQIKGNVPSSIHLTGSAAPPKVAGTEHHIVDSYVPVGATTFTVDGTSGLHVGDTVIVHRPSTADWIHDIGMDIGDNPWAPGSKDLDSDRVITAINGHKITVDAPLTNALEQQYEDATQPNGLRTIYKYSFPGRINNVGVEAILGDSAYNPSVVDKQGNQVDENHAWTFISVIGAQNVFVRHVAAYHFAFSAVDVQKTAKWVTVEDAYSREPISKILPGAGSSGGRRYSFHVDGQLTLVRDAHARDGRHDFVQGSIVPGPNVFLDCTAENSHDESGPHDRWATGALYDNVVVQGTTDPGYPSGGSLEAYDRGLDSSGSLQGWDGANMVFWNCTASSMTVEAPPTAQNYAIGCTADSMSGDGFFESSGAPVSTVSLYEAQLHDRLSQHSKGGASVAATALPMAAGGASVLAAGARAVQPNWGHAGVAHAPLPSAASQALADAVRLLHHKGPQGAGSDTPSPLG
jgi:hypothetical protein